MHVDGTLGMSDIDRMLHTFELDMTASERDQFFAYCDIDGNARISSEEFQAGWDQMMKVKVLASLEGVGMSRREALAGAALAVISVAMLAVFIVVGVDAFTGADGVGSTIQSFLILAISRGVANSRAQAAYEAETTNKNIVTTVVEKHREAVSDVA